MKAFLLSLLMPLCALGQGLPLPGPIYFPGAGGTGSTSPSQTNLPIVITSNLNPSVGQWVGLNGSTWVLAEANSTGHLALGVVTVASATQFTYVPAGVATGLSGLSAGTDYYLSDATPGLATSTAPTTTTSFVQSLGVAILSTSMNVNILAPPAGSLATIPVASGGTGLATVTTNAIPYGQGTSPLALSNVVNSAVVTTSAGGVPTEATALPNGITGSAGITIGNVGSATTLGNSAGLDAITGDSTLGEVARTGTNTLASAGGTAYHTKSLCFIAGAAQTGTWASNGTSTLSTYFLTNAGNVLSAFDATGCTQVRIVATIGGTNTLNNTTATIVARYNSTTTQTWATYTPNATEIAVAPGNGATYTCVASAWINLDVAAQGPEFWSIGTYDSVSDTNHCSVTELDLQFR